MAQFEEVRPYGGAGQTVSLSLAGAIGVAAAIVADFVQKGDASAVNQVQTYLWNYFGLEIPHLAIAGLLILAGSAAVFVNEPTTKRAAFTTGASVLAILMTLMPVSERPTLASDPTVVGIPASTSQPEATPAPESHGAVNSLRGDVQPTSFEMRSPSVETRPLVRVQTATVPCEIVITLPGAQLTAINTSEISVVLHDDISRATFRLASPVRATGTSNEVTLVYAARMPVGGSKRTATGVLVADLQVRVEAPNYKIAFASAQVSDLTVTTRMELTLVPSSTPLQLQRLYTPRKF
ncbi:MAG: hypothetical protein H6923_08685 [Alphaproteobacteria bacterium]|nr:hypothetical protein [Alphaproteobacteria bacterium]